MKHTGVCPKCNSKKIGHLKNVIQRAKVNVGSKIVRGNYAAPIGIERSKSEGTLKVRPVGKLEAYICGSCGFYETYIKDPSEVQYESIVSFKWINPS